MRGRGGRFAGRPYGGGAVRRSRWVVARAVADRWTLVPLFMVLMLLTFALAGVVGRLDSAIRAGVTQTLDQAPPTERATQVALPLGADPRAQSAAAARLFGSVFPAGTVDVYRTVAAGPFGGSGAGTSMLLGLRGYPDLADHVRVLSGQLPIPGSDPLSLAMAMTTTVADRLALKVGDGFTLQSDRGPVEAELVGLYAPIEVADPLFFESAGDPTAAVDQSALGHLAGDLTVRWTISPNAAHFDPDRTGSLIAAVADLRRTVNNDAAVNSRSVVQFGDLSATLAGMARALAAGRAVSPIPVLLLGALGLLLVVELILLLHGGRRTDTALMRSRGIGRSRLVAASAAEATVAAVPAVVVGLLAARWCSGGPTIDVAAALGAMVVGVAVVSAMVVMWRDVSGDRTRFTRIRWVVLLVPSVTLFVAAGLSLARFRHLGAAIVAEPGGSVTVDPVAVVATPLLLMAAAVVATGVAGLLVRLLSGRFSAWRGSAVLPMRQVDRRWPGFAMVNVVLILAVAGTVCTATFTATWTRLSGRMAELQNAADVRIELPDVSDVGYSQTDPGDRLDPASPGVVRTDALVTAVDSADVPMTLLALPGDRISASVGSVAGAFDAVAAGRMLRPAPIGLLVPVAARRLDVRLAVGAAVLDADDAAAAPVTPALMMVMWLAASDGRVVPVRLGQPRGTGPDGRSSISTLHAQLPGGSGAPWRVVALDAVDEGTAAAAFSVDLVGLSTDDGSNIPIGAADRWDAQTVDSVDAELNITTRSAGHIGWGAGIPAASAPVTVRLMPAAPADVPVPVMVDPKLAGTFGLGRGGLIEVRLAGTNRHLPMVVAAVSPLLPGPAAGPALLADLGTVMISLLRSTTAIPAINQILIRASTPAAADAAAEARAVLPRATVVEVDQGAAAPLLQPVSAAYYQAALASLLLGVLSLSTLAAAQARRRAGEAAVLIALGCSWSQQVRHRCAELGLSVVWSVLLGVPVGLLCASVTTPYLARSALTTAAGFVPTLSVAPILLLGVAAVVAAQIVVVLAAGRTLGRSVRRGPGLRGGAAT